MESTGRTRIRCRRRVLLTLGVSFMEIAGIAYRKARDFGGPLGIVTKKMSRLASFPSLLLVYSLHYKNHLLAILSFVDDLILSFQSTAETIFPPSKYVFDKIDQLVEMTETLPAKFDFAVDKFPIIIHQIPFLDWALSWAISWLNFWLSILTRWGSETTKEKEIVVDINCDDSFIEQRVGQEADNNTTDFQNHDGVEIKEGFSPVSASSGAETDETISPKVRGYTYKDALEKVTTPTYKDALEKGTKDGIQNNEECTKQMIQSGVGKIVSTYKDALEKGAEGNMKNKEQNTKQTNQSSIGKAESTHKDAVLEKGTEGNTKNKEQTNQSSIGKAETTDKDAVREKEAKKKIKNKQDSTKQMIQSSDSDQGINAEGETNENVKEKECIAEEETKEASSSKKAAGEGWDETANEKQASFSKEDPILALFDSAWLI